MKEAIPSTPVTVTVVATLWIVFGIIISMLFIAVLGANFRPRAIGYEPAALPLEAWYLLYTGEIVLFVGNTMLARKTLKRQLHLLAYASMTLFMVLLVLAVTYVAFVLTV